VKIATRFEKPDQLRLGDRKVTSMRDDKPPVEEPIESEQNRNTPSVSTRVGKDNVDIDVPALKHLVDTVKDKLKP